MFYLRKVAEAIRFLSKSITLFNLPVRLAAKSFLEDTPEICLGKRVGKINANNFVIEKIVAV